MRRISLTGLSSLVLLASFAVFAASVASGQALLNGTRIFSEKKRYTELEVEKPPKSKKFETVVICEEDTAYINEAGQDSAWSWIECGTAPPQPGEPCGSGTTTGVINFNNLAVKIANVNYAENQLGIELKPAKGSKVWTTFTCGTTKFELKGAVIGQVTPVGVPVGPSEAFTLAFNGDEGQEITHFEGKKNTIGLELRTTEGKVKSKWDPAVLRSTEYLEPPATMELHLEKPKK
jgi:hypothetical protein